MRDGHCVKTRRWQRATEHTSLRILSYDILALHYMSEKLSSAPFKKEDIYPFLKAYYESIGRNNPPNYRSYSLHELKKCLALFGIRLVRKNI